MTAAFQRISMHLEMEAIFDEVELGVKQTLNVDQAQVTPCAPWPLRAVA